MKPRLLISVFAVTAALGACASPPPANAPSLTTATSSGPRPTDPFRAEHAEIRVHLDHVEAWVGELATATPEGRRATMQRIVGFFREHIVPHAAWEERVLYPAVDRRAASGPNPFTATMRYEHRIVGRWTDELASSAASSQPDTVAFARRADNLLGLIRAHFEEEEEVLLPILDRTMSKAEFEREIGAPK